MNKNIKGITDSANADFLCDIWNSVDVDLVELDMRDTILLGVFLEHRRDLTAGAAPSSPEVKDVVVTVIDLQTPGWRRTTRTTVGEDSRGL